MLKVLRYLVAIAVLMVFTNVSNATIIDGEITGGSALSNGGVFTKLTPPLANPYGPTNSVGNDTFQSPNLYGFDEDQNVLVENSALQFDLTVGGSIGSGSGHTPNPNPGSLPVDTEVASHYIFFDPGPLMSVVGSISFDSDIIGVIVTTGHLFDSDYLANTNINYLNPGARGLELSSQDYIIEVTERMISIDFTASTPGDYIRVLTTHSPGAIPEPTSILLFGTGLGALGLLVYRRKRK